jgi:hypothetical protein
LIAHFLAWFGMLAAVKFNRETQCWAIEIQDVRPGRVLPPEAETVQPTVTQLAPKALFDFGRGLAKSAGTRGL